MAHEMAKRWVKSGHQVTHFSANFPGAKKKEKIAGVTYLREGTWYNVHVKAFFKILFRKLPDFDVIIDEVHGIPFFADFYLKKTPVVAFACEVAKDVWDQMYPFPFNVIGKFFEKIYLLLYRNATFFTISQSTKKDLVENGIKKENVTVVPMGFTYTIPKKLPQKSKVPTLIFLGRLAKSKGVPNAIRAFNLFKKEFKTARMYIVGKGETVYEKHLRNLVKKLQIADSVEFCGFVSEKKKFELLAKSHFILVPSVREGWGLIVPEANIVKTPAIVYNVPGLKDVTKNGINGFVAEKNTPQSLAKLAINTYKNKKKYKKLAISSQKYAKSMSWDETAKKALNVIKNEL